MMKDKDIVKRAHEIFKYCEEQESENNALFVADLKFANADSDNGWQWDERESTSRKGSDKPALTINKVKVHNRQITNELRQNPATIKVRPVDSGADPKTAEIFDGAIRHIQEISGFNNIVDQAMDYVVDAGLAYWRVTTDYESEDSFNQEIYITAIDNPMNCYLYGYKKIDGSDATDGFIFENMKKEEFEHKYGKDLAKSITWDGDTKWINENEIRVCEHFYSDEKSDTLYANENGDTVLLSSIEDEAEREAIKSDTNLKKRKTLTRDIKWCLIAGDKIIDKKEWLGKTVPIVKVFGEEVIVDGKSQRRGNTRAIKDPQRMYNYWTSSAVEFVALQGKTPWDAPVEAIQGYEDIWATANNSNHSFLPWNHQDENGNPIPRPQKSQSPTMAQAYIQGMEIASNEIQAASGQFDAQLGQNINQQSGRALSAVQRKGDNATYHYTSNRDIAIKYTGAILVDLIPKIYDTERIIRILGEDNKEEKAQINPELPQSYMEKRNEFTGEIQKIYNPSVGRYDVLVQSGASYGTKRQEAFEALSEIASRNPQLMQIAGDLIMKAADFPMADKIAERIEKTLPPELKDQDENKPEAQIPPEVQQHVQELEMQIKAMDEAIQKMTEEIESKELEQRKLEIDQYNAETNRIKAMPVEKEQQAFKPEDDPEMAIQMHMIEMRKAEAEAKLAEVKAEEAQLMLAKELQQIEMNEELKHIAHISSMAARPRRSQLEFDDDGMPISSVSYPIDDDQE